ncbi:MAG: acyl-CoA dehydrogenase [Alcaligenaceae bacterium]|nr:acyl-CoA dehydrogenase [Alcaligenaceae bacterium]
MTYQVPVEEIRFVFKQLADLHGVLGLPAHDGLDEATVEAVLQENARFVESVVAPLNHLGDTQPAYWENGEVRTPPGFDEAFRLFGQGGWQGLQHDPQWGGQGLPRLLSAAASENLHAANMAFGLCPMLTDGVIEALSLAGSAEQCEIYIPPLLEGRWTGTMNLTEPQAGSDLSLVTTRAVPQNEGSYRLYGQKIFITYGEHNLSENIVHLVLARLPGAPQGVKGISLFIVPKFLVTATGAPGKRNDVWCASVEHKLGIHGSPTAVLLFGSGKGEVGEGAIGYLVGEENRGLEYMFIMMNAARFGVGVQGVGLSERALQFASSYARERVQSQPPGRTSGPATIDQHPDVQRMLLTMRALTEGARATALYGAALADKAHHHPDDAEKLRCKALYEFLVPVIKGFSTEMAVEVTSLGVQVFGGMGYIEETGAAQFYRDARILPIYEGTTAIQANDFVGRKIVRNDGQVALSLVKAMRETVVQLRSRADTTSHDADVALCISERLETAIAAYEQALDYVLKQAARDPRAVFMGSVPLLMLAGVVHAGWQMGRSALACMLAAQDGRATDFERRKLTTALFYATNLLPRARAYADAITAGHLTAEYAAAVWRSPSGK